MEESLIFEQIEKLQKQQETELELSQMQVTKLKCLEGIAKQFQLDVKHLEIHRRQLMKKLLDIQVKRDETKQVFEKAERDLKVSESSWDSLQQQLSDEKIQLQQLEETMRNQQDMMNAFILKLNASDEKRSMYLEKRRFVETRMTIASMEEQGDWGKQIQSHRSSAGLTANNLDEAVSKEQEVNDNLVSEFISLQQKNEDLVKRLHQEKEAKAMEMERERQRQYQKKLNKKKELLSEKILILQSLFGDKRKNFLEKSKELQRLTSMQ